MFRQGRAGTNLALVLGMIGRRFSINGVAELVMGRIRAAMAHWSTVADYVAIVVGGDGRRMIPVVWAGSEPLPVQAPRFHDALPR